MSVVLRLRMAMGASLPIIQPGAAPRMPRPEWLKVRLPGGENYTRLKGLVTRQRLHTVCESARRPCGFGAVPHGKPLGLDTDEPRRVAEAVAQMKLGYAVITSVNRDDVPDGGAAIFASTIGAIRRLDPGCKVEVLIPDFR